MNDYRDLVIRELADSEADLLEQNRTLVDLLADLAWENVGLRVVADRAFRQPHQRRRLRDDGVADERAA